MNMIKMKRSYSLLSAFSLASIALFMSANIHAEELNESTANEKGIERIQVTAQKRSQSIQDIGVAVSAFSGDELSNAGVVQAKDVADFTPGLSSTNSTSGGSPIFAIRGIGLDDFNSNNSSGVGVYFDEVFASSPAFLNGQLMDVERVEVLKGPQGTLYGRNTTGGAINFISKKPTDYYEGYITASYGRWNSFDLSGAINGPITKDVSGRFSYSYGQADGWQTDALNGKKYGETDRLALRGQLKFDGTNYDSLLKINYSQDDSLPPSPQQKGPIPYLNTPDEANAVQVGSLDSKRDEDGFGISFHFNYHFESISFTSITAFDSYDRFVVDNLDGTQERLFDFTVDENIEQTSQEFRLTSTTDGPFTWILGANYAHEEINANNLADVGFVFDPGGDIGTAAALSTADYIQKNDSYGVYLHTETELAERWTLTAGARYSHDKKNFDGESVDVEGDILFTAPGAIIDSIDNETRSESNISYRLGLGYDVTDDLLVFGNFATGYKGGVFFAQPAFSGIAWDYVGPEEVFSYELGFKATLLDGDMILNATAFHYDYDDRQSLVVVFSDNNANGIPELGPPLFESASLQLTNIAKSEIDGAELELHWLPIDGLDFMVNMGYLDTEVSSGLILPSPLALLAPVPLGSDLAQAPKLSYSAMVGYEWNAADDMLARVEANYSRSGEQVAALADPNAIYGPQKSLNVRASLSTLDEKWSFAISARNLTDEDSSTYSFTNFLNGRTFYRQKSRYYAISATYRFE